MRCDRQTQRLDLSSNIWRVHPLHKAPATCSATCQDTSTPVGNNRTGCSDFRRGADVIFHPFQTHRALRFLHQKQVQILPHALHVSHALSDETLYLLRSCLTAPYSIDSLPDLAHGAGVQVEPIAMSAPPPAAMNPPAPNARPDAAGPQAVPPLTPISPFKPKQNVLFQILTDRIEDWQEKTYCARILLRDGSEMEVQATKAGMEQWKNLPKYVAHTAEITRTVIKPYKAEEKTGIHSEFYIRTQFRLPTLQRAVAGFPLHVVRNRTITDPRNFGQLPEDLIFNVAGYIHTSEATHPNDGPALARRKVVLANGDWHFTVHFLGAMTRSVPVQTTKVVIFSLKKRTWQGIQSMETTRFTWCLEDAPWLTVAAPAEGMPPRKALRTDMLEPISISEVKQADGHDAACVLASMLPLDDAVLATSMWVGQDGNRMRLPITLRDDTGNLHCTLWSSEFAAFIPHNVDELSELYAACDNGLEAKQAFLDALNTHALTPQRWTLRPRLWQKEKGDTEIQWNVANISEPDA